MFDASFFHTEEAVLLEEVCGLEGVGIYLKLLCALREAESYSLTNNSKILSKLFRCSKKNLEKVLEILEKNNLIFLKENKIFSKKILDDVRKLEKKKEQLSDNANKRWNKEDIPTNANAMQLQCKSQVKDKDKEKVKDNTFGKDTKGNLLATDIDQLEIPNQWDEPTIRDKLKSWLEYKSTEKREPYKTLAPLKALLTQLAKSKPSTELVCFAFDYAMSKGWHGVVMYPEVISAFGVSAQPKKELSEIEKYRIEHGL